ncbi:hypothetical protein [Nonomuraea jabiensis]|uniref:Haem-binding uptake Tiki superfamily ChaN domain-containing protein n=1 Tax=Nonomuraea jabiensis TaxID=882448 RepID=A0A7W9L8M5_9ACTN|nr:hypothetical protein [Nonomuraea jabiensis]MBB5774701.1 hypothetical protein [Nonomuraea jabiensis]
MPAIDTMDGLRLAIDEFDTQGFDLLVEAKALDLAARSLAESGLLLLGEVHGVRENPLIVQGLMRALRVTTLALEWPEQLKPELNAYLAAQGGLDHPLWWTGDGRITAGHFAVLKAMKGVRIILFDGLALTPDWSQRDAAMARRILDAHSEPTLVLAGNAHTQTFATDLGTPMGAHLTAARPAMRSIRIAYGTGSFYNLEPRRSGGHAGGPGLHSAENGELIVGLPVFSEAMVPHLPDDLLRERFG